jgi:hypothetical protein
MSRYLYATALLSLTSAFVAWMFAVLTGIPTGGGVGLVLFGFGVVMAVAGAVAQYVSGDWTD